MKRKTLVTGGTGFVGSAVVRTLLWAGFEVRALARRGSSLRNLQGLPVEFVPGDLCDCDSLSSALQGCDSLFHAAADYRLWVPQPQRMYAVNVQGTRNLMEAALEAGVERIVYTSSVATLQTSRDGRPMDESRRGRLEEMIGHYKASKFLAEEEVRAMVRGKGLPAVIVQPTTPVGPRDIRPTPTGRMIVDAAGGKMPAYVDSGLNIVHVDDVAAGHLLAYERGRIGESYILGGENMTLREIFRDIAELTGGAPPRLRLPHSLVLPVAYAAEMWTRLRGGTEPRVTVTGVRMSRNKMYFTSRRAHDELGYNPRPVREGLADAVEWFRKHEYLPRDSGEVRFKLG